MFKHLLVPLDGSRLAESVLPMAGFLSMKMKVAITFIHIIEKDAPAAIHGDYHLATRDDAENYLKEIAGSDKFRDSKTEWHVHEQLVEDVPSSITAHSNEFASDLILMCTHGKGGVKEMIYGSIAQKVIAAGNVPLLLINPAYSRKEEFTCSMIMVPVDGHPEHEQALDYAVDFAGCCHSRLHFIMAVPYFGSLAGMWTSTNRMLPNTSTKMMDMLVHDGNEYLEKLKNRYSESGIDIKTLVIRDDPPKAIAEAAEHFAADLIVLGTHRKKGTEAFWSGSVTPKVGKNVRIPILLIPVKNN